LGIPGTTFHSKYWKFEIFKGLLTLSEVLALFEYLEQISDIQWISRGTILESLILMTEIASAVTRFLMARTVTTTLLNTANVDAGRVI